MTQRPKPTPAATAVAGVRARPVRLNDGATWGLARPDEMVGPVFETDFDPFGRPTTRVVAVRSFGYPYEVARKAEAFRAALKAGAANLQFDTFHALASALLRRAHDVDEATADRLLDVGGDATSALIETVLSVLDECPPAASAD